MEQNTKVILDRIMDILANLLNANNPDYAASRTALMKGIRKDYSNLVLGYQSLLNEYGSIYTVASSPQLALDTAPKNIAAEFLSTGITTIKLIKKTNSNTSKKWLEDEVKGPLVKVNVLLIKANQEPMIATKLDLLREALAKMNDVLNYISVMIRTRELLQNKYLDFFFNCILQSKTVIENWISALWSKQQCI